MQVDRAKKQLLAIEREEMGLEDQLKDLEESLSDIRHHKEEYQRECTQLQNEQKKAAEHVQVVESTLSSLVQEIDKVRYFNLINC